MCLLLLLLLLFGDPSDVRLECLGYFLFHVVSLHCYKLSSWNYFCHIPWILDHIFFYFSPTLSRKGLGLGLGLVRSSGEGNGNRLQFSWLENPMDSGGAWWTIVLRVTKSQRWRKQCRMYAHRVSPYILPIVVSFSSQTDPLVIMQYPLLYLQ